MTTNPFDLTVEFILAYLKRTDPERYRYWLGVIAANDSAANDSVEVLELAGTS